MAFIEIVNLGKADELPPVIGPQIFEKLAYGISASSGRGELPHDLAVHRQARR